LGFWAKNNPLPPIKKPIAISIWLGNKKKRLEQRGNVAKKKGLSLPSLLQHFFEALGQEKK
jgi:hypothetical protein